MMQKSSEKSRKKTIITKNSKNLKRKNSSFGTLAIKTNMMVKKNYN